MLICQPHVVTCLHSETKANSDPLILRALFHEHLQAYEQHIHIYTDGSKEGSRVAAAAVVKASLLCCRLPDDASVFTAELTAIKLALNWIARDHHMKFVVFSDSLSSMQAIYNRRTGHPILQDIMLTLDELYRNNKGVTLFWVPSHVGISGNEKADRAAKVALGLCVGDHLMPYSDLKPYIDGHIRHTWQTEWSTLIGNKLHAIKPKISETKFKEVLSRGEETLLHRLRIGHTFLTHGYLLRNEDQPQCTTCNTPLTVQHILLDCSVYASDRLKHLKGSTLKELFEKSLPSSIVAFVKDIGLFSKL